MAAVSAAAEAPYADLAAAGMRKILDVLDPGTRQRVDRLAARVWVNHAGTPARSVMSAVEQAMTDQKVLRLEYTSADGTVSAREVEPVLFASTGGRWYLVGWCRLREGIRWFRLDRIGRATVTTDDCTGHTIDEVGTPPRTAESVHLDSPTT